MYLTNKTILYVWKAAKISNDVDRLRAEVKIKNWPNSGTRRVVPKGNGTKPQQPFNPDFTLPVVCKKRRYERPSDEGFTSVIKSRRVKDV